MSTTTLFSHRGTDERDLIDIRGILQFLDDKSQIDGLAFGLKDVHACVTVLETAVVV